MMIIGTKAEIKKFKSLQNTVRRNCMFNDNGCGKCIYNDEKCYQGVLGTAMIIDVKDVDSIIMKEKNNEK